MNGKEKGEEGGRKGGRKEEENRNLGSSQNGVAEVVRGELIRLRSCWKNARV